MKLLEEFEILVRSIREEKLDGLSFLDRSEILKRHSHKFDELLNEWIEICRLDQFVPFNKIKSIIHNEITDMEQRFQSRPSPKLPNTYDTLLGVRRKLNYLKYEVEKKNYLGEDTDCYCILRLSCRIQPDFTALSDYGRAILYYEDDDYVIKQCRHCQTKWINDDSYGSSRGWHKWDPEEFLIKKVFDNK